MSWSPPPSGGRSWLIGLDQTGAARSGGRSAKPLPRVDLRWEDGWWLEACRGGRPWRIDGMQGSALDEPGGEAMVLVDACLGLPSASWARAGLPPGPTGMRRVFARAARWPGGYGRRPAHAFLETLDPGGDGLRVHDRRAGAMSLFRTIPFQREIGTGSYRIWRDLGTWGSGWCTLWPHEPEAADRTIVAEAWPSLGWRQVFGRGRRQPADLAALLRGIGVACSPASAEVLQRSPDHADAAVAALLGAWAQARGGLSAPRVPAGEGALLGWGLAVGAVDG